MPIGISYTGANGKSYGFSSSGVNESLARLKEVEAQGQSGIRDLIAKRRAARMSGGGFGGGGISNEQYHKLQDERRAERNAKKEAHKLGLHGDAFRDFMSKAKDRVRDVAGLAKKLIGFGSSIEEKNGHLQLKGDDKFVGNGFAFGKNGKGYKGFWNVAELLEETDKRGDGNCVESGTVNSKQADGGMRESGGNKPFSTSYVTRVFDVEREVEDEETGKTTKKHLLVLGLRTKKYTGRGRVFEVSQETLYDVCELGEGGGGGGEVTFTGTDGVSVTGSDVEFAPDDNTNLEIKFTKDSSTGKITGTIGVYWYDDTSQQAS